CTRLRLVSAARRGREPLSLPLRDARSAASSTRVFSRPAVYFFTIAYYVQRLITLERAVYNCSLSAPILEMFAARPQQPIFTPTNSVGKRKRGDAEEETSM